MTFRSLLATAATLCTLCTLTACGSDSTAPNPASASIGGNYSLRTVNGTPLPFTLQSGSTKVDVLSSTLTITDGGTWSETPTFRITVNGGAPQTQVESASGIYVRAGSSITFTNGGQAYLSCTFDGRNALACTDPTSPFSYSYSK